MSRSRSTLLSPLALAALIAGVAPALANRAHANLPAEGLFARTNLVAWCIVPFDSQRRGPEQRAAMLERLGLRRLAYDWRTEHIPTFDAEIAALQKRGIELTAWWFPSAINAEARAILDCLSRHRLHPELWVTLGTEPEPDPTRLQQKIVDAANTLAPICVEAARLGSKVGLYNHLGWFGEPTNQLAVLARLRSAGHTNAGIVYNFHHGHAHIDRFPETLAAMQPHLLAVNLNGMIRDGDRLGKKIIPLGTGDQELPLLQTLARSGWRGPVGILGHTDEDAEVKLRRELAGLEHLIPHLPSPISHLPTPISPGRFASALDTRVRGLLTAGKPEFRRPGLLIEALVRLEARDAFNIIAASEAKSSPTHWELYTYAGSGELSFFLPGAVPAEIKSGVNVCDGRWHHVAALYRPEEVQLFVDGGQVARQSIARHAEAEPGAAQFAIGRLVEGELGCQGAIEAVRLGRGPRPSGNAAAEALAPNANTLAFWSFATPNDLDGWSALAATVPPVGPSRPRAAPATAPRQVNRERPWEQTEGDWVDDRWNRTLPARWQAYYLPTPSGPVRKGLSIRLGESSEAAVIYDTATGNWRAAWTGGFLKFDPARFGLLNAPRTAGTFQFSLGQEFGWTGGDFRWRGFGVQGERVALEYSVGDVLVRDSPWSATVGDQVILCRDIELGPTADTRVSLTVLEGPPSQAVDGDVRRSPWFGYRDGDRLRAVLLDLRPGLDVSRPEFKTVRLTVTPRPSPLRVRLLYHHGPASGIDSILTAVPKIGRFPNLGEILTNGTGEVSAPIVVQGQRGSGTDPYAIDTVPMPYDNPWQALMFGSGIGFFDDGDAAIATIHGDVWRVSGLDENLERVEWRRIATGLFQPLGLTVVSNQPVVLCRDHLTRLHDRNGDRFTDYYESLSSLIETSAGGHDYVTSLCRDDAGNFYYVDPRGAHRIPPDGQSRHTIARGFRNPNGMGISPDGKIILVAPQQGEWTPSSVIHELRDGGWYGYPGPRPEPDRPLGYDLPLCWIPHRIDNSSGSQVWATSDRFGPLSGHILHLAWGRCTMLLTLRDVVDGVAQGAVVPLKGRFLSGPMRGAFNPKDGQLYVVGSQGWQTAAARDGSLQRVRWTGRKLALPINWRAMTGALEVTFNEPLDPATASDPDSYALEAWNYRYAAQYGSKDWSVKTPDREGHDIWAIQSARLADNGRSVTLAVPDLQPVMQFQLRFNLDTADRSPAAGELYGTIHKLHPGN